MRKFEMRHLSRSQRSQRVAILTMLVLMGIYLVLSPVLSDIFGGSKPPASSISGASQKGVSPGKLGGFKKK